MTQPFDGNRVAESVMIRYKHAYWVARIMNGIGILTRMLGLLLALGTFGIAASVSASQNTANQNAINQTYGNQNYGSQRYPSQALSPQGFNNRGLATANDIGLGLAFVAAVGIGLLFCLIGMLFSAQGQLLKATLDGAVNTSPFLTDNQRAQILSL